MKISGLDQLNHALTQAATALEGIDGELGTVSFDPYDPGSIEGAIKRMEALIDEKVGPYAFNPIIAPVIQGMKEMWRQRLLEHAAAARLARERDVG